jgi:hypothetical protein
MCKRDLIHSYYTDSLSKLNYNREKKKRGREGGSKVKYRLSWIQR